MKWKKEKKKKRKEIPVFRRTNCWKSERKKKKRPTHTHKKTSGLPKKYFLKQQHQNI